MKVVSLSVLGRNLFQISCPLGQNKGNRVYERWKGFFKRKVFIQVEDNLYSQTLYIQGAPKKYSRLTMHGAIVFCFISKILLDSKYLFIDLDFDTSITQI